MSNYVNDDDGSNYQSALNSELNVTNLVMESNENDEDLLKWKRNKKFYKIIQVFYLTSNTLCALSILGLSIWLTFDERFRFLEELSNDITYSNSNLLFFGNLLSVCYYIAVFSLAINLILLTLFIKSYNFLKNYIVEVTQLGNNIRPFKSKVKSFKAFSNIITYICIGFYGFFIISFELGIFLWFHRSSYNLTYTDVPNTLWKLVKEYENHKYYIEEQLVINMQKSFDCCHLTDSYQFGPEICNQERACLVPIQIYTYNLCNTLVLFYLLNFILNFIFQILHFINFNQFFVRKLLYFYKPLRNQIK